MLMDSQRIILVCVYVTCFDSLDHRFLTAPGDVGVDLFDLRCDDKETSSEKDTRGSRCRTGFRRVAGERPFKTVLQQHSSFDDHYYYILNYFICFQLDLIAHVSNSHLYFQVTMKMVLPQTKNLTRRGVKPTDNSDTPIKTFQSHASPTHVWMSTCYLATAFTCALTYSSHEFHTNRPSGTKSHFSHPECSLL